MKKGMTMEQYMAELEAKKARAEAFDTVLKSIDDNLKYKCNRVVVKEGYYETYTNDDGEEKKRYVWPEYEKDENGDDVLVPPTEGDYSYNEYIALLAVKEEILAII